MTSRPLGSRYTLDHQVGKGAMGAVWAGHRNEDGKEVAVKVLRSEYADDAEIVHRFIQERSFLVRVVHGNVVQVHDLVVEGSTLAIVMEFVAGGDLRGLLDERRTLPPGEAAWYGQQIARGLAAIHERGVIHRDVKPGNVLLAEGGEDGTMVPKVSDFGVARVTQALHSTTSTAMLGTPLYMAPEVIEEEPPGPATDIYALGVMLYEMVVGVTPFAGPGGTYGVLRRHSENMPGRPEHVPDALWDAIERMVAKDAADRPDAAAVAEELGHLAEELRGLPALDPITTPPPGLPAPRKVDDDGTVALGRQAATAATGGDATRQVDPAVLEAGGTDATRVATPAGPGANGYGWPAAAAGPGGVVPGAGPYGPAPVAGSPNPYAQSPDGAMSAATGTFPVQGAGGQGGPGGPGTSGQGAQPMPGQSMPGQPMAGQSMAGQSVPGPQGPGGPYGNGGAPAARGRSRLPLVVGGAVVVLVLVVLVWFFFLRSSETPDLSGQTVEQAQTELGEGTEIVTSDALSDGEPVGTIVGQVPAAGEDHDGSVEVEVARPSTRLYLDDLDAPAEGSFGYPSTEAVEIAGTSYPYSIVSSPSWEDGAFGWDLAGGFQTFRGTIGRWQDPDVLPEDQAAYDARVVRVQVIGDGSTLWSGEVTLGDATELDLDVTGVETLAISYTATDGGPATIAVGDGRVLAAPDEVPSQYRDQ
ncbi:MAG: protein kinase domain-containing protein [Actinomycetaceae bacterium]